MDYDVAEIGSFDMEGVGGIDVVDYSTCLEEQTLLHTNQMVPCIPWQHLPQQELVLDKWGHLGRFGLCAQEHCNSYISLLVVHYSSSPMLPIYETGSRISPPNYLHFSVGLYF